MAAAASGAHMGAAAATMTTAPVSRFASNLAATATAALAGRGNVNAEHGGTGLSAVSAARPVGSNFADLMKPSAAIQKGEPDGNDDAL